jgi:serine/threonine protein kinase
MLIKIYYYYYLLVLGMYAIHKENIIYQDIKPQNILVFKDDSYNFPCFKIFIFISTNDIYFL